MCLMRFKNVFVRFDPDYGVHYAQVFAEGMSIYVEAEILDRDEALKAIKPEVERLAEEIGLKTKLRFRFEDFGI